GEGNDLYMISDQDQITDTGAGGFDRGQIAVSSGLSLAIGGWSGIERVSGLSGNDTISAVGATTDLTLDGGDGNDVLTGGSGNDSLFGGNGADRLIGGTGDDFIVGGDGADVFVFATGFGNDALRDFANGSDLIDLSGHEGSTAFSDLTLTQAGAHVVIEVTGTTDSITVLNTSVAVLGAEDFIFA
ncbi:MAG: hypothetical protein LPK02_01360, partial [Rhodobacterales bacterium]|nr:hypothetical protein [Rhodobacterales bacterium]